MEPRISVLMATYKQSKYIMSALTSIPPGIPVHVTVPTIDRETLDILATMEFAGIHKSLILMPNIWEQKQMGIDSAWSSLRPKDYNHLVCRLDSDDVYCPGWFEKALPIAEDIISRGKIPIIGPSFTLVDHKLKPIKDVILPEFSMDKMLEGCIIPEYSITTLGALLGVGGYFSDDYPKDIPDRYRWYAMMLRVLKKYECEVRLLPDIGFLYRQHKKSAHNKFNSRRFSKKNVEYQKKVAEYYFPERVR